RTAGSCRARSSASAPRRCGRGGRSGRRARADWSWGLQGWGRPGTGAAGAGSVPGEAAGVAGAFNDGEVLVLAVVAALALAELADEPGIVAGVFGGAVAGAVAGGCGHGCLLSGWVGSAAGPGR